MTYSVKCTATTKSGEPCKAYAIRGRKPYLCSTHAKANAGAGAPPGNQNATKHGFYGKIFTAEELAAILETEIFNLEGEIALTRILLRRLNEFLSKDPLQTPELLASIAPVAFTGVRTVAKLLAAAKEISSEGDDPAKELMKALDELSVQWHIKL